ncbi:class I SAM-dependent methyltransferase [Leptospira interrogans]|uniref:Methyltransferase domain protein n=1 Tax=Leptospira interrogans serovar Lora str. TE 1992 TaxID=1193028 RepID=M3ETE0_LEPIR|nr:class I SAM-dependent methyltransferase [Leptospira interrogans]AKH77602.1 methyltransferase [Leptospira interrogans serovar Bratislava]EMF41081.1 methyltransferase domain protein [Leptospira interrogans serovar Lora str. TE 1992]EMN07352.1 methyltransferase domain protein [Leptospira interrogans serovar Muenchen str. Brem 129]KLO75472.1 Methyltransferase domain protein [Leptospira interrogans serovar Muenchen]
MNSNQILCRLCGSAAKVEFFTRILNRYDVTYYKCKDCELIQSEFPFWLQEAYEKAISILDTGIFLRNKDNVKKLTILLTDIQKQISKQNIGIMRLFQKVVPYQKKILDYGGGHGILVRLLRDVGFNCYWYDKYAKNDFAVGFEFDPDETYDTVLAFELFEHFENPKKDIKDILELAKPRIVIFSTLLYGNKTPKKNWWYYAFEAGQHIAFYNSKTLQSMEFFTEYSTFSLAENLHLMVRKDLKLNLNSLKRSLRKFETRFSTVRRLYNSKTFEDHIFLKHKIKDYSN